MSKTPDLTAVIEEQGKARRPATNHNPYGPSSVTLIGTPATRKPAKPPRRIVIEWAKCCKAACDLYEAPQVAAICDDYLKALSELAVAERQIAALKAEGFDVPTTSRAPSADLVAASERTGQFPAQRGARR